jgi:hypothetical protein
VNRLTIFLNELSSISEQPTSRQATLACVLSTLAAVRAARRIRTDITVSGNLPLTRVRLGDGSQTLSTLLSGNDYKEEWRLVYSIDQMSPWESYPDESVPGPLEEVRFQGNPTVGMLWAQKNATPILRPTP